MNLSEFGAPLQEQGVRLARRSNGAIVGERELACFPRCQCLCLLRLVPRDLHLGEHLTELALRKEEGEAIRAGERQTH